MNASIKSAMEGNVAPQADGNLPATVDTSSPSFVIESALKKSIVASCGAIATSLFVTPLDVAKTRLQAQKPPSTKISRNTTAANYCYCTHYRFSNGLMDIMVPKSMCKCFDIRDAPPHLRGTFDALRHIMRAEGTSGLWSGLPPSLLLAVPSTVFYFTSYDLLVERLRRESRDTQLLSHSFAASAHALSPMLAGGVARIISASIVSPLELLRTRMQSKSSRHGLLSLARSTVEKEGVLGLWSGLSATLLRDVPFSCIYWFFLEQLKDRISRDVSERQVDVHPAVLSFLSGSIAGSLAALCTQPFDIVKTRQQIAMYSTSSHSSSSSSHSTACAVETTTRTTEPMGVKITSSRVNRNPEHHGSCQTKPNTQMTVRQALRSIVREEGVAALYTGIGARIAKIAPACGIMISSYEVGKRYFNVE